MHFAWDAAAAMALAMGHARRGLHSFDGACCVSDPNGEAFAGANLWIVSRVSAGNCGGLRGIGDAQGRGQSAAGEVGRRSRLAFFRPFGACCHLRIWTPAVNIERVDLAGVRLRRNDRSAQQ